MASFFKIDLSEDINAIKNLEIAFNKEQDNIKSYAFLVAIEKQFADGAKIIRDIIDRQSMNRILIDSAKSLASVNSKKFKK